MIVPMPAGTAFELCGQKPAVSATGEGSVQELLNLLASLSPSMGACCRHRDAAAS